MEKQEFLINVEEIAKLEEYFHSRNMKAGESVCMMFMLISLIYKNKGYPKESVIEIFSDIWDEMKKSDRDK
jgi:hypothetical protein